jgi:serine/threonine protein kinase
MALKPGDTLLDGKYHIQKLLGRGGFGFVYLAQETILNEERAIKELIPALVGDKVVLKRFLAEAKATMRLTHEQIVRTYDVFHEGDNYYIVMEYMAGGALEERLQEHGPLPPEEAVRISAQVCEGLDYAHDRGVVHCDLKPANILFTADGLAKVADFGIAQWSEEMLSRSWMTPAGFMAGTLPYMSPEQTEGVRDDRRIDVYALGAVLYRVLTGRVYLGFDQRNTPGATADNVLRIRSQHPEPPSTHNRRIPAWLDEVVLRTLAKEPEERYATAGDLRAALLQGESPAPVPVRAETKVARPLPRATRSARPERATLPRWFWSAAGGAAFLLVVVIAIVALVGGRQKGEERATPAPTQPVVAALTTMQPEPTQIPTLPAASTVSPASAPTLPNTAPILAPTEIPSSPLPVQAYVLPDDQPYDVAYDGSVLWVLYYGDLVRLEPVESEGRFREAERIPLDASSLTWAGSPGKFWMILGWPFSGTPKLALVDREGNATAEYTFPKAVDGWPRTLAWDGEFAWVTLGGRLLKLRPAGDGGELAMVDSYALDVGLVDTVEEGLAWDGEALWVLVWDQLARLDQSAQPTCMLQLPSTFERYHQYRGLAWDGEFLWVADFETGKLYRADPAACQ